MSHPSSLDLEAFACGEDVPDVRDHLDACDACRAFVSDLSALEAPSIPVRALARAESRRALYNASYVAVPLAAAAALLLLLRSPGAPGPDLSPRSPAPPALDPTTEEPAPAPTTSFKGGRQVAVIRERAGEQQRFTGRVPVRDGDRLRVEVAIDREQVILAAVVGDDGSYLELMPAAMRSPGTHYSDKSARVSGAPSNGTIVVGTREEIARARGRRGASLAGLPDVGATVRVEWEAP